MNIVQLTPGAGGMYCGNCLRDNALVAELRRQGHNALMLPLYLPLTLDETDQSAGTPVFFGGINVYLEQKFPWLRNMPGWLHKLLASPPLLKWAAGRAAKTRANEVGELTLSMFRGEQGNQARELDELVAWLKSQAPPDMVCLSNVLLIGMVRKLKSALRCRVTSMLAGEDSFLDNLPAAQRADAWSLLAERAQEVDWFIAPSDFYAQEMTRRLHLAPERVRVVPTGIGLEGYPAEPPPAPEPPVLGYFARMCREKGLGLLVDAFLEVRRRNRVPGLKLKIGGGCGPGDEPFVAEQRARLECAGLLRDVEFHPNLARAEKVAFLQSLSVFSVPALYGESFGLYLVEALAAGVPVVQPKVAAFPEIVVATGGGLLADPNPAAMADKIEELLLDPGKRRTLARAGHEAVHRHFNTSTMAATLLAIWQSPSGLERRHPAN